MAGKQRSVFIRFNMADEADCSLYMKLAEAAGSSASLTAYVKRALEEHFSSTGGNAGAGHEAGGRIIGGDRDCGCSGEEESNGISRDRTAGSMWRAAGGA